MFRESGVVHSFKIVGPVLFLFESQRDLREAILRETDWSFKNWGIADGLVTLPRKIKYS